MPRCLRDDFRMYYAGTYITRLVDGVLQVMSVEDVTYANHGYNVSDIHMIGCVYELNAGGQVIQNPNPTAFTADQIRPYYPQAGYYMMGNNPCYLEFQVQNRTNRKGFENNRILHDGQIIAVTRSQTIGLFLKPDFKGKIFQDMCIHRSRLLWRGSDVGSFHDGQLELSPEHEHLREHVTKYIEQFKNREA